MKIKGQLKAINSRRDMYGNCYWAMVYTDFKTGRSVRGEVSGGSSNIFSILGPGKDSLTGGDDWDRSIMREEVELPIREFNRITKGWAYAGCTTAELSGFIRAGLKVKPDPGK